MAKDEIPGYEEKAKFLLINGWKTWYHYDNWIKTEWIDKKLKYDMMGVTTEKAYKDALKNYKLWKTMHIQEEISLEINYTKQ